jgi:hypothetical protein
MKRIEKPYPENSPLKFIVTANSVICAPLLVYCLTLDMTGFHPSALFFKAVLSLMLLAVCISMAYVWWPRKEPEK